MLFAIQGANAADLNLTAARLAVPAQLSKQESKAIEMLRDEVEKRTLIRFPVGAGAAGPVITISRGSGPADGYSLKTSARQVTVAGNDARGMLFGVGRLLRELHMRRGHIAIAADLNITTAPKYALRGHQLGYRPKTNSYDGWSVRAVGAVHPRPGGFRHQCHRADSAALGRCSRQPALSRCRPCR